MAGQYIAGLRYTRHPEGLYAPIEYVLAMGGKRLRPVLMLMACNLYKDDVAGILPQAAAIEIYHNYTLLHDDVMDRADLRRGKPTVHKVWSDNAAILSGDAMLVLAYDYMAQCPPSRLEEVLSVFGRTALGICEGQQLDMEFERRDDVSEAEYMEMIRLKTSVLLAGSLHIGALLGGAPAHDVARLYDFGINTGLAFQLKDDLLDVYGDASVFGKNIGGDILCNKKTYLLIKALELATPSQAAELRHWLQVGDRPQEKIAAVTALYDQTGVRQACEERIDFYAGQASRCLADVQVPDSRKQALDELGRRLVKREV